MMSAITAILRGFCFALLALTAHADQETGTYDVGLPHPSTNVPYAQALKDAQFIASQNPDWDVARCQGYSMSPFFTERSVLLVKKLPFEKLREGMVAVYTDHEGDLVAHKVVDRGEHGWRCQAFQNDIDDPTPVTRENFRGIAFAVLNAQSGPEPELLAKMDSGVLTVIGKTYK